MFIQRAADFALQVTGGKLNAPQTVIQACDRFIADVKRAKGPRSKWALDPHRAEDACAFLERLPHVKGRWAKRGDLLKLTGFQIFAVANLYGWIERKTELRRFRKAFIELPRKNGKSFLAAGLGNYHFAADGDYGAEVYSGATSEKQAWEVFRPARAMWGRAEELREEYDVKVNAKNLVILDQGARFEPIIGNPGDGSSPSCAVIDEFHEHDSWAMYDTMATGMGAREEPLLLVITTSGSNLAGPCHEYYQECKKVLDGSIRDDRTFIMIYEADEADRWDAIDTVKKVNPNVGVTVSLDFLKDELNAARRSASKQNAFRTKHLNQWVGARSSWMNMLAWQATKQKMTRADFAGERCHVAVDLAQKIDVCTVSTTFLRDGDFFTFVDAFVPEGAMQRGDKRTPTDQYIKFKDLANFHITPSDATDYATIETHILNMVQQFAVISVGYDEWQAEYLAQRLMAKGVDCVKYQQNVRNMSAPMKEVEARVLEKKFHHDGCPVLAWFIGNVRSRMDQKENEYPAKDSKDSPNKIDGAVSMIMSVGLWMTETDLSHAYESRGFVAL